MFGLCVDNFGIRYHPTDNSDHILNTSRKKRNYHWLGRGKVCGLNFDWNYEAGYVDMTMPGYIPNKLNRIQHTPKVSQQYSSHHHTGFKYCTPGTQKYATVPNETPTLSKKDTYFVQSIVGSFFIVADRLTDHSSSTKQNQSVKI